MRKAIDYKVIYHRHPEIFENRCQNALKEGWEVYGAPSQDGGACYQVFVKYEDEKIVTLEDAKSGKGVYVSDDLIVGTWEQIHAYQKKEKENKTDNIEEIRDVAEAVNKKGAATEFSDYETIQEPTIEHALRSIKEWMAQGFVPICKLYYIGMGGYYGFRCHMVKPK